MKFRGFFVRLKFLVGAAFSFFGIFLPSKDALDKRTASDGDETELESSQNIHQAVQRTGRVPSPKFS